MNIHSTLSSLTTFCSVPYDKNKPMPKLCKDCKHFLAPKDYTKYEYGQCAKFGNINLVDGKIEYQYAMMVRKFKCKDELFEPRLG